MTEGNVTPATHASQPRGNMFAPGTRFQVAWDSTSLGLLKECPRKYYYEIICGWRPKATSVHLVFGQLYHAGLEGYDHFAASIGKLDGNLSDDEHDEAVRMGLRRAFNLAGAYTKPPCLACNGRGYLPLDPHADALAAPEKCELCEGSGKQPNEAPVWQPWKSEDPNKNMWTLTRSLILYSDHFRDNPMRTVLLSNGKPAVELSFFFEAGEVNGITYAFCGHLDRMVNNPSDTNMRAVPHDRKTTKGQINTQYWKQFSPHNQFSLYNAACAVHYQLPPNGIVVDAAQVLVNTTQFARQFIAFPPQVVNEWLREADVWINAAARYAEAGFWPRNDKSCGNYGGCSFQRICSKAEFARQSWLEMDFHYNPWNPLETRGDI
jgi:hypothetical protein